MTKRKELFVIDKNDVIYVQLRAVMNPLCAVCDGLPLTFFGKGKTAYITLIAAIEWCRNESKHHSADRYDKIIAVLERAKTSPINELA